MNKYYIVCFEKWENGIRVLPRIEYTMAAESREKAVERATSQYPKYAIIEAWEIEER